MRPLCKGLVTSERMGATADVRVRNMCTIKTGPKHWTVGILLLDTRLGGRREVFGLRPRQVVARARRGLRVAAGRRALTDGEQTRP